MRSPKGHRGLRKGRYSQPGRIYHVTTTSCQRQPLFLDLANARDVVTSLGRENAKGEASTLCFMLMPDHLHWLLALRADVELSSVVCRVKARSARRINARRRNPGTVWSQSFHDRAMRYDDDVLAVARYIVGNPLRDGLVPNIGLYPHWDAVWVTDKTREEALTPQEG